MKRTMWLAMAAGLVLVVAPVDDAAAQGRGNGRDRDERYEDRRERDRDRDLDRNRDRNRDREWNDRNGRDRNEEWEHRRRARELEEILRRRRADDERYGRNAPPFCRNGRGHPVHGREWCRQKGYGLGGRDIWRRVTWGDIGYRRPRSIYDGRMSRGTLADILGGVLIGRFDAHGRSIGRRDPLYGRWFENGTVLQITSGSYPIAQVIDRNRDGRADSILLYGGR